MEKSIVNINHLKYIYPDSVSPAINNVSLRILKGQWTSLVGLNGSGKSTLIKLIDGLLPKTSGQIVVDGFPMSSKFLLLIRSKIGIVFQDPQDQFVGSTVKDEVAFGLENQQVPPNDIRNRIKRALSAVGMKSYENSLIDRLSGGQQQRIAIADVIVMKPEILVLDEATSMLNPRGRVKILNLIQNLKRRFHLTVIDITHDVEETRYAQRLIVMDRGRIVLTGSTSDVYNHEKVLLRHQLEIPKPDLLRDELRRRKLPVPDRHFTELGMLKWLRRLFLKT